MSRFVLDCSVAMSWCFQDETTAYSEAVLDRLNNEEAVVPSLWPLEVSNVLVIAERRGRIDQAQTTRFLALLRALPIRVIDTSFEHAVGPIMMLARTQRISAYDAAYLAMAMQEGLPLATGDAGLRKAAVACAVTLVA